MNFTGEYIKTTIGKIQAYQLFKADDCESVLSENATNVSAENDDENENDREIRYSLTIEHKVVRFTDSLIDCRKFFQCMELQRDKKFLEITNLYDTIGPLLTKLESIIMGTTTGECDKMTLYYVFWEETIFVALQRYNLANRIVFSESRTKTFDFSFVVQNLQEFIADLKKPRAIFQVDAVLSNSKIIIKPTVAELYNFVVQNAKEFLEK